MDTSAAIRAFKRRRGEGVVGNFVARHAGHKTNTQSVCMGKKFHLTNTIGPLSGGKVAYAVMLEAVGVA